MEHGTPRGDDLRGAPRYPASAKPAPVTKMKFKLDVHEVPSGGQLTGGVEVLTRSGHAWLSFPGAPLSVRVDGVEVGTAVADAEGYVELAYPVPLDEGDHVMKIVFAGDELHKRAQRAQGFSVTAAEVPTDPPAPTVPEAPVLTADAAVPGSVALSWTVPADGGSPITGYVVYRGDASGAETELVAIGVQTTYADLGVVAGSTYYYVVTAVNAVGASAWSAEVVVTAA